MGANDRIDEKRLYGPLGPFEVLGYSDGLRCSIGAGGPSSAPLEVIRMTNEPVNLRPYATSVDVRHGAGRYTVTISLSGEVRVDQHYRDQHGNTSLREITSEGQNWKARLEVLAAARRRLQEATDAIPLPFSEE